MELDKAPLWRGDHVPVRQVVEDFASYLYLPRLQEPAVLLRAVVDGVGLITWADESFGYADGFDEANGRYRGLRGGKAITLTDVDAAGVIVKADVARPQIDRLRCVRCGQPSRRAGSDWCEECYEQLGFEQAERAACAAGYTEGGRPTIRDGKPVWIASRPDGAERVFVAEPVPPPPPPPDPRPTRFHGSVLLDAMRTGRDAGRIADEVICCTVEYPRLVSATTAVKLPPRRLRRRRRTRRPAPCCRRRRGG